MLNDRKFTAMEMNIFLAVSTYDNVVQASTATVLGDAQTAGQTEVAKIFTLNTIPTITTIESLEPYKGLLKTQ
jgi:hypothetical protein